MLAPLHFSSLASARPAGKSGDAATGHTAKTPRAGRRVGVEGEGWRGAVAVLCGVSP